MIQDITPHIFNNEFDTKPVSKHDYLCIYRQNSMLLSLSEDQPELQIPTAAQLNLNMEQITSCCTYLFSIDQENYYLLQDYEIEEPPDWKYFSMKSIRSADFCSSESGWKIFACSVGEQLHRWFDHNRYCSCCGSPMNHHPQERAFLCSRCKHVVYPVLSPSVIVAVIDSDRILLTKYARSGYQNYALVAGYTEIGETLEQTVTREVLEETGLHVKDIRYYKSQPWPFTDTLLAGFFAQLDGDSTVTLQESELSEGVWFHREDIPYNPSTFSLTNEMIEVFRTNSEISMNL